MPLTLTIHRGSREIGGSCVEIATASTRVVLDVGMALEAGRQGELPGVAGVFAGEAGPAVDAVVISHSHPDHWGLLPEVRGDVPVWASAETWTMIDVSAALGRRPLAALDRRAWARDQRLTVGDIEIEPIRVDHSAFDAHALLVRAAGRSLLYSGDLRRHGRKGALWRRLIERVPKGLDALVLEGTALSRPAAPAAGERSLERRFLDLTRNTQGPVIVAVSGQNIDRLVTLYRAARRSGRKLLVDPYTGHIMRLAAEWGPSIPHPAAGWSGLFVYFAGRLYETAERIAPGQTRQFGGARKANLRKELDAAPGPIVVLRRDALKTLAAHPRTREGILLWSQWRGYLEGSEDTLRPLRRLGLAPVPWHTSGHADVATLRDTVAALAPRALIPIHTEVPDAYAAMGAPLVRLRDGEPWTLDQGAPA